MKFTVTGTNSEVNILKRADCEAIPIVVADSVFTTDTTIAKAGTPLASDGTIKNDATCVGILLHDVTKDNPNGALLKKAYIDSLALNKSFGADIAAVAKAVLPMIVFE